MKSFFPILLALALPGGPLFTTPGWSDASRGASFGAADAETEGESDVSWSIAVIPDTQNYVKWKANAPIFGDIVDWILANRDAHRIRLVLHEGDIVQQNNIAEPGGPGGGDRNSDAQWSTAKEALARFDGVLPLILAVGNHDYGRINAEDRTTRFNDYFSPSDNPLIDPAKGGLLHEMAPNAFGEKTLENAAYIYRAPDSRKLLILSLEWAPRNEILEWANGLMRRPGYRDHTAVLLTHAYLYHDDTRLDWHRFGERQSGTPHMYPGVKATDNDGEEIWRKLVRHHPQFAMVLNGHVGGDMTGYLASEGDEGNVVHQMLFNAQFLPDGGEGRLRLLQFLKNGTTVRVRTYSVRKREWIATPDQEFSISIPPLPVSEEVNR